MKWISILLLSFQCSLALANDSAVADFAGQVQFLKEDSISIQKEVLEFFPPEYFESKGWASSPIKVSYVMKNESAQAKRIDIAFPLPVADLYNLKTGFSSYPNSHLPDMKLTVNGKDVSGKWEQIIECKGKRVLADKTPEDLPDFDNDEFCENPPATRNPENLKWKCTEAQKAACNQLKKETGSKTCGDAIKTCEVRRVYRWSYEFPAHKEVSIVHRYTSGRGMAQALEPDGIVPTHLIASKKIMGLKDPKDVFCVKDMGPKWFQNIDPSGYSWNEYVLIPGANWKGPIRHFEFIVHRASDEIVSTCVPNMKKSGLNEVSVVIKDFTPTADIVVGYLRTKKTKKK